MCPARTADTVAIVLLARMVGRGWLTRSSLLLLLLTLRWETAMLWRPLRLSPRAYGSSPCVLWAETRRTHRARCAGMHTGWRPH